jgi:hypothetical protein
MIIIIIAQLKDTLTNKYQIHHIQIKYISSLKNIKTLKIKKINIQLKIFNKHFLTIS